MTQVLSIALIVPSGIPAVDDVGFHVAHEAEGLARRGHRVAVLGPSDDRGLVRDGRKKLGALRAGTSLGAPGEVLTMALGRSVRVTGKRRVGDPLETARAMEAVLRLGAFDVAHVHEPLTASPALGVVRRHEGVRAATFHTVDRLAGAALLQPLLARSLSKLDVCIASSIETEAALQELAPRDYLVISPVHAESHVPPRKRRGTARIIVLAGGRDGACRHFAKSLLAGMSNRGTRSTLVVSGTLAARRAARATNAEIVTDPSPLERAELFEGADVVAFVSVEGITSVALHEAMFASTAIVAPRGIPATAALRDDVDALLADAFSKRSYVAAIHRLMGDPALRRRLGGGARKAAQGYRGSDAIATLEEAYRSAREAPGRGAPSPRGPKILRRSGETRNATGNRR